MRFIRVKQMHFFLMLALGAAVVVSFQNCGRGEFKTISSNLSSQGNPDLLQTCTASVLDCETDTGYGHQICTQISPQNISLGICVLDSCKVGLTLVNGNCIDTTCPSGTYLIGDTCGVCPGTTQYDLSTKSCVIPPPPPPPKTCTFDGKTLQIGEQVVAYNVGSVSGTDTCVKHKEIRKCIGDNNLSGSYTHASCTEAPPPPKTCIFNGKTLQYGEQVKAYNLSAVYGSDICANHQEIRTCYGDYLSGSYPNATCKEAPPVTCLFNGKTLQLGEQVAAYSQASAPGADVCANHKEMRKCIGDNILSGSYPYATCIDDNPPPPSTCPAGLSNYTDMTGKKICAYFCPMSVNFVPTYYKCPNGFTIIVGACNGNVVRTGAYMSSIPKANASYACTASGVYP